MHAIESTNQSSIKKTILHDRSYMEEVIKKPFGAIATLARQEMLLEEAEIEGVKSVIEKDLVQLAGAFDRKKDLDEEESRLHWVVCIMHTVISQGRTEELYESISKSFPEF